MFLSWLDGDGALHAGLEVPGHQAGKVEFPGTVELPHQFALLSRRYVRHVRRVVVHAGVLPSWTARQTMALAAEVSAALGGADPLAKIVSDGTYDTIRKKYFDFDIRQKPSNASALFGK